MKFKLRSHKFKMAASAGGRLMTLAAVLQPKIIYSYYNLCPLTQVRHYAARKGTRERARKKKVKKEVVKVPFVPFHLRVKKEEVIPFNVLFDDDTKKKEAVDDVWIERLFRRKVYSFNEAIECHRDTHQPERYDDPNAFVNAFIEINMQTERPTKLVEKFSRNVHMPHIFDHGEKRRVIAFAKTAELQQVAKKAGAEIVGGKEIITQIQTGDISINDFHAAVAHPEIMVDLTVIRGLMKRKFPNPRTGTLGLDLSLMIKKILHGIKYVAKPYERQTQYGTVTTPIGLLSMDNKQLEENFITLIKDVESVRPNRQGPFIFRTSLRSPPTTESFKINFEHYLQDVEPTDELSDDEDDQVISNTV
ncbi:50S ribosomal protein L1 [Microplitis demolitor]|uniref:50S ribosomal protein L1 n=1 Tax=Microplitis demolitor TaxID=69319 RepID=UPI0004CC9FDB|nr:50S ribosomal protein L1 [Microplitis demolitor]